jgi:uncharacterized membrane protein YdjX (TVP38/TMEM64 family)
MKPSTTSFWKRWRKWGAMLLALIALTSAWYFFPVKKWVAHLDQWVESQGAWGIVVFLAAYAIGTVLFFPGSLMTIGAGLAFGLWRGVCVVSAGSILGASLAFLLARHFVRKKVEAAARSNPRFQAMDHAIGEQGWKMVALLRLSPLLPFNLSNYLYGITKVGFWPYIAASWIGMLPGTFLYVYLGAAGKEASSGGATPWKWALFGAGFVATIVVTVWISRLAKSANTASAK